MSEVVKDAAGQLTAPRSPGPDGGGVAPSGAAPAASERSSGEEPAANPFHLGFFTQAAGVAGQSDADLFARIVDTIVAAEELGYESVWVGQHHFALGSGRVSSPLVLLAAVAAKTRRIRLGTAITTLPLEDPIRLAEDAAMLDAISGGRVELGIGAGGGDRAAFGAFGLDYDDRRGLFDSKLATLHTLFSGGSLTGEDDPRRLGPAAPGLRDRVWHSVGTPERATAAGEAGDGLLIGTFADHPLHDQKAKIDAYLAAWGRTQPAQSRPRIGALRFTYVGESRASIEERVERELNVFRQFAHQYKPDLAPLDTEGYLRRVTRYGTVEDVIADLRDDPALLGYVTDFLPTVGLYPAAGNSTPGADLDIERLELFATRIAPALGWRPPAA
ncbi:LLM class flavin-dependent oxidoreductase [Microbacterium sp. 18062]|uniref:LLM class flavin-dependent oxidoreductase n=1 Tax=Microbacterium sp. 18062 TaxID=2681410 RepID=UPI001356A951|nr:LLM class flavin-dependent oxidoreductase [Microbacterium sp. 18062]